MGGGASREPGQKTRQRPSSLSSRVQRVIASKFGVADSDDSDDDEEERRKVREQKHATVQQKSVRPPRSVFWHALLVIGVRADQASVERKRPQGRGEDSPGFSPWSGDTLRAVCVPIALCMHALCSATCHLGVEECAVYMCICCVHVCMPVCVCASLFPPSLSAVGISGASEASNADGKKAEQEMHIAVCSKLRGLHDTACRANMEEAIGWAEQLEKVRLLVIEENVCALLYSQGVLFQSDGKLEQAEDFYLQAITAASQRLPGAFGCERGERERERERMMQREEHQVESTGASQSRYVRARRSARPTRTRGHVHVSATQRESQKEPERARDSAHARQGGGQGSPNGGINHTDTHTDLLN